MERRSRLTRTSSPLLRQAVTLQQKVHLAIPLPIRLWLRMESVETVLIGKVPAEAGRLLSIKLQRVQVMTDSESRLLIILLIHTVSLYKLAPDSPSAHVPMALY